MYEACFIKWWGHKDRSQLTFIERIKIRLHKSNLYFCIYRTPKTNKTKYCISEHERENLLGYAPALIKFTGDSSYPYKVKFYGKYMQYIKQGDVRNYGTYARICNYRK